MRQPPDLAQQRTDAIGNIGAVKADLDAAFESGDLSAVSRLQADLLRENNRLESLDRRIAAAEIKNCAASKAAQKAANARAVAAIEKNLGDDIGRAKRLQKALDGLLSIVQEFHDAGEAAGKELSSILCHCPRNLVQNFRELRCAIDGRGGALGACIAGYLAQNRIFDTLAPAPVTLPPCNDLDIGKTYRKRADYLSRAVQRLAEIADAEIDK